nr:hypothetical protein B0A51_11518 [Rachicladosporium sp. CCFEE 5018]
MSLQNAEQIEKILGEAGSFHKRAGLLDYSATGELCTSSPVVREISDMRLRATDYPSTVKGLQIRDDVLKELSALLDREYNAWYTVHRLMLATLLDAEGLYIALTLPDREYNAWYMVHQFMLATLLDAEELQIPPTIVSYAYAAANLVYMAEDLWLKVLPHVSLRQAGTAPGGERAAQDGDEGTALQQVCDKLGLHLEVSVLHKTETKRSPSTTSHCMLKLAIGVELLQIFGNGTASKLESTAAAWVAVVT